MFMKHRQSQVDLGEKPVPDTPIYGNAPIKAQPAETLPEVVDAATQLKRLQELKDAGLLTDEEYQIKRKG